MISVTYKDNINVTPAKSVSANTTIAQFLSANNYDPGTRSLMLNGQTLTAEDREKTFAQLGFGFGSVSLLAVARKENA